jgi:hypothetical protein
VQDEAEEDAILSDPKALAAELRRHVPPEPPSPEVGASKVDEQPRTIQAHESAAFDDSLDNGGGDDEDEDDTGRRH